MTRKRNGVKPHQETSKHHTPGGASGSSMNALTTPITATNSMAAYAPEFYNRNSRPHYFFRASEPSTGFLSNWYASEPFTDSGIPTADAPAPGFGNENTEREWRLADSAQAQTIRARSFRAALLATGDRLLVEASPFDSTWGIGFAAKDADAKRERWGSNLLGHCLMDVRERFRKEEREV